MVERFHFGRKSSGASRTAKFGTEAGANSLKQSRHRGAGSVPWNLTDQVIQSHDDPGMDDQLADSSPDFSRGFSCARQAKPLELLVDVQGGFCLFAFELDRFVIFVDPQR